MKNPLLLSFLFLVVLTLCTGLISYFDLVSPDFIPVLLMAIAFVKFYLVAFEFMELKKAHVFWKVATVMIGLILAAGIALFSIR